MPAGRCADTELVQLIEAVATSDRMALRTLYDATAPKLYGVILRIQRDRTTAEDVLQEVYLRIWQAADSYSVEAGRPLTWLGAIARNHAIDSIRSARRKNEVQGPVHEDGEDWLERLADPTDMEDAVLGREALRACLSRLDPAHRDCVVLAYCEGYSREDLAERFARPVNTIKTWLHRALSSLKICLDGSA